MTESTSKLKSLEETTLQTNLCNQKRSLCRGRRLEH